MRRILYTVCLFIFVMSGFGKVFELFPGEDASESLSRMQPGDTLLVKMGVHRAPSMPVKVKGTAERPVVICGEDADLSIFSAWGPDFVPRWEPVSGERFVYVTGCDFPIVSVTDLGNDLQLQPAPGILGMSRMRGTFYYSAQAKSLYVHAANGLLPTSALRVGSHSGHLLTLQQAEHLVLRDLTFTGSAHMEAKLSALGSAIRALETRSLRIENCRFYFNSGGVNITNNCYDSIVRNCFFRQNNSYGYSEMAQLFFGSSCKKNQAIDNIILDGRTHGLRFYSGAEDCTARGNIIVNEMIGLYFKASKGERLAERNVVAGCLSFNFSDLDLPIRNIHNTLQKPSYLRDNNPGNLVFEEGAAQAPLFAAPEYLDYRLQGGSSGFGAGAYPDPAPVLYAANEADAANNGKRVDQPLSGLQKALDLVPDHGTIYLQEGVYPAAHISRPVFLRGRGNVQIAALGIESGHVELVGLRVDHLQASGIEALECRQLQVKIAQISASSEVTIQHCEFKQLQWQDNVSSRVLFSVLPQLEYSGARCGGNSLNAGASLPGHAHSSGLTSLPRVLPTPELEGPVLTACFPGMAAISWITPNISSDAWRERDNWWTPRPVVSILEYGLTPECEQQIPSLGEIFHSVSIRDLQPGTRYYYRVLIPGQAFLLNLQEKLIAARENVWQGSLLSETGSFTTPERPVEQANTWHLKPGELARYSELARPGDTLILAPGVYQETFRPAVSGLAGAPITLKAEKSGQVILDGAGHLLPGGVYLDLTDHIIIDGIIFRHFANKLFSNRAGMEYGQVQILRSNHVQIRNCVFLGQGAYQFFINMKGSGDIRIQNNVFFDGVNGLGGDRIGNLLVEQNTFYAPSIRNFMLNSFQTGSTVHIRHNLFLGQIGQKAIYGTTMGELNEDGIEKLVFDENVWFFSPENKIRFCGFENISNLQGDADGLRGLERLRQQRGWEKLGFHIEQYQFANGKFIDPWEHKLCQESFVLPIARGEFTPYLDFFDPAPGLLPENTGARSRRP